MASTIANNAAKNGSKTTAAIVAPWITETFSAADLTAIQKAYAALATLPSIAYARFLRNENGQLDIQTTITQRDLESKSKRKFQLAYAVESGKARSVGFATEIASSAIASIPSPSDESLLATLRVTTEKEKKRRFVEIGNSFGVWERVEVTDVHADFYAGEIHAG